jgi:transcriptional regulator with XRE-family HTH domain
MGGAEKPREGTMSTRNREQGPLALRLVDLRYRARLNRSKLAERSGVSADLIQSLEQGRTANPTLDTLLRLSSALEVTVGELIEDVPVPQGV